MNTTQENTSPLPQQRRLQAIKVLTQAGLGDQALALAGAPQAVQQSAPVQEPPKAAIQATSEVKKGMGSTGKSPKSKIKAKSEPKTILGTIRGSRTPGVIIIQRNDCPPCDEQGGNSAK